MVDVVTIGMVLSGAVLLFAGAALSVYGTGLLGAILGGGAGYMVGPSIGAIGGLEGPIAVAVGVLLGAVVGVAVTYILLSVAIASMAFIVGIYLGVVAVDPIVGGGSIFVTALVGLGTGVALAFLGMFLTRTTMVVISSFIGAALVSRSITFEAITTASNEFPNLDSIIFDVTAPLFLGLFVLGVLSQFGLFKFGYVTKTVSLLPGATVFTDDRSQKG